jgi:hypothetical protein
MELNFSSSKEWMCFHSSQRMGAGIKIYCARIGGALPLTGVLTYTARSWEWVDERRVVLVYATSAKVNTVTGGGRS